VVPWLGLASCLFLSTRIDGAVWLRGLILLGLGLVVGGAQLVPARRTRESGPARSEVCSAPDPPQDG
jgi:hypothetical protein